MAEIPEIRLLGELEVVRSGSPVPLPPSKKTRALLGYLAATGRPQAREKLCDLLWQGPDDPRAALRWSLAKLRRALGSEGLAADREHVALGNVTTDFDEVRELLRSGVAGASDEALRAAAARYRGELLEGLNLPDCYRYHEWCSAERESARAIFISVLAALVARSTSRPEEALGWARQRAAVDPLSETAHVDVVRLLAELGRKREALAQYETCSRILAQETGARPSPALLEARMRIGRPANLPIASSTGNEAASDHPQPVRHEPAAERAAPASAFLGRRAELGVVENALERAERGDEQRVLMFLGEPGMGKSRLLDELKSRTHSRGGTVLAGRAFEAEMVRPYGPWIDALRGVPEAQVPEALRSELTALLPELGGSGAVDRTSLFDAVVRLLVELSQLQGPVALLLDDVQWFDEASAALLHYAARAIGRARVVIGCGARPGELSDNPAALRLVRGLARDGRSSSHELGPLDEAATVALARALSPDVDAERVVRESAGNPLLAIELVRAIARGDGTESSSIGGLLAERLGRLDPAASELLAWAAALGKSFDLTTLEHVTGTAPLDLISRVRELERHGMVRASADGAGYDFAHDLMRSGAYRQLSEPQRRVVHRSIARALAEESRSDDALAGEVAHHAALGGDAELAASAALAAAHRCLRMFAGAEAARLADAGMQRLSALPREQRIRLQVAFWVVHVYSGTAARQTERIQTELSRAIVEAHDAGLRTEAAEGFHALSALQFDLGNLDAALESTLRAADVVGVEDAIARARQLGSSARCLAMLDRDMDRAHALYLEARALADQGGQTVLVVEWSGGLLEAFMGETVLSVTRFERALGLARSKENRWEEYECLRQLVQLRLEAGDAKLALSGCAELLAVAARMGEGSELPVARALEALCLLVCGDPGADEAVSRQVASLRGLDAKGMLSYVLTFAADHDARAGRLDDAERRAAEALSAAEVVNRKSQMALSRAVLARVALARGHFAKARSELDSMQSDLERPMTLSQRARTALKSVALALASADPPK